MNTVKGQKRGFLGKEIKRGGFKQGYHALPHNYLVKARAEICAICFWTVGNFRVKLAGSRPFRNSEVKALEDYFASKGIDAWTGEPISK